MLVKHQLMVDNMMLVLMTFHQSLKFLCSTSSSLSSPATVLYDGWVHQTLIKTELSRQPQSSNNRIFSMIDSLIFFFTSKETIRIIPYGYEQLESCGQYHWPHQGTVFKVSIYHIQAQNHRNRIFILK